MPDFQLKITARPHGFKSIALQNTLRNLGKLPTTLAHVGDLVNKRIKQNLSGRILRKRTGKLHDSWDWEMTAINAGWRLTIGSDVVYAAIHNFGGWTGRGHKTKIKKTRYVDRAILASKAKIRSIFRNYMARLTR